MVLALLKRFSSYLLTREQLLSFKSHPILHQLMFRYGLMILVPRAPFLHDFGTSARKSRAKTAFTIYNSSEQSSDETEHKNIFIPDRAVYKTKPFHVKPPGLAFALLEVLQSSHRAFSRFLNYRYYCLVNERMERQQHEMPYTRRHIKDLKTLMITFDRADWITITNFLSRLVEVATSKEYPRPGLALLSPAC